MPLPIPHTTQPRWPEITGDRFAGVISRADPAGCRVALLGAPDDLGVRLNHGRPGAAEGPAAFRAALARFGTTYDLARKEPLGVTVYDAGDVEPAPGDSADALDETHRRLTEACSALHRLGLVPVVIGGGHDLTFPAVRALADRTGDPVGGINVDPHLDVRETTGSGMPYRRLIDGGHLDPCRFIELGVGRFSNSREHVEWLLERGATLILDDHVLPSPTGRATVGEGLASPSPTGRGGRGVRGLCSDAIERAVTTALPEHDSIGFVSVDLDVIDGSQAPGVSSVNPAGLSVQLVCDLARRAGADTRISHFDIMELSPPNDDPPGVGRTARTAALIFLHFISGFSERPAAAP